MGYMIQDIIEMCDKSILNIPTFYKQDFINYRGRAFDTNELFTEIIAEYVLSHINEFENKMPMITRQSSYKQKHDGVYREGTGRDEEVIAIKMFLQSQKGMQYDYIGKILDYQTPLKSKRTDIAGKIDLISYDGKTLRVLELKKSQSTETLLRCVLEGYTYFLTLDKKKLLVDFMLPADTIVETSPLVFYGGAQWKEWKQRPPKLMRLMDELGITPYFLLNTNEKYVVMEE